MSAANLSISQATCPEPELRTPEKWVADDTTDECTQCKSPFGVFRRRHHCRGCGKLFCANCLFNFEGLKHYNFTTPQLTCSRCMSPWITHCWSASGAVPTAGGEVWLVGYNFGKTTRGLAVERDDSKVCEINGIEECRYGQRIRLQVPPGTGGNRGLTLGRDKYEWLATCQFSYAPPQIFRASEPSTAGGRMVLFGNNFGESAARIKVRCNGIPVGGVEILEPHKRIACLVPPGCGDLRVTVDVDAQQDFLSTSYAQPYLLSASPCTISSTGGALRVMGNNFGNDSSAVRVLFQVFKDQAGLRGGQIPEDPLEVQELEGEEEHKSSDDSGDAAQRAEEASPNRDGRLKRGEDHHDVPLTPSKLAADEGQGQNLETPNVSRVVHPPNTRLFLSPADNAAQSPSTGSQDEGEDMEQEFKGEDSVLEEDLFIECAGVSIVGPDQASSSSSVGSDEPEYELKCTIPPLPTDFVSRQEGDFIGCVRVCVGGHWSTNHIQVLVRNSVNKSRVFVPVPPRLPPPEPSFALVPPPPPPTVPPVPQMPPEPPALSPGPLVMWKWSAERKKEGGTISPRWEVQRNPYLSLFSEPLSPKGGQLLQLDPKALKPSPGARPLPSGSATPHRRLEFPDATTSDRGESKTETSHGAGTTPVSSPLSPESSTFSPRQLSPRTALSPTGKEVPPTPAAARPAQLPGGPWVAGSLRSKCVVNTTGQDEWAPDTESCQICDAPFNVRNRRHHCRVCGACVCSKCSPKTVNFNDDNKRSCLSCHGRMSVLRAMNGVRQSLTVISEVLPTRLKEAFIEDMIAALLPEEYEDESVNFEGGCAAYLTALGRYRESAEYYQTLVEDSGKAIQDYQQLCSSFDKMREEYEATATTYNSLLMEWREMKTPSQALNQPIEFDVSAPTHKQEKKEETAQSEGMDTTTPSASSRREEPMCFSPVSHQSTIDEARKAYTEAMAAFEDCSTKLQSWKTNYDQIRDFLERSSGTLRSAQAAYKAGLESYKAAVEKWDHGNAVLGLKWRSDPQPEEGTPQDASRYFPFSESPLRWTPLPSKAAGVKIGPAPETKEEAVRARDRGKPIGRDRPPIGPQETTDPEHFHDFGAGDEPERRPRRTSADVVFGRSFDAPDLKGEDFQQAAGIEGQLSNGRRSSGGEVKAEEQSSVHAVGDRTNVEDTPLATNNKRLLGIQESEHSSPLATLTNKENPSGEPQGTRIAGKLEFEDAEEKSDPAARGNGGWDKLQAGHAKESHPSGRIPRPKAP